jgi:ribonuclease HI
MGKKPYKGTYEGFRLTNNRMELLAVIVGLETKNQDTKVLVMILNM